MKVDYFCSCFLLFVPAKNPAQSVPISTPQTIGTLGSIATAAAALLRRVMKPWKPEKKHRVDACRFLNCRTAELPQPMLLGGQLPVSTKDINYQW